MIMSEPTNRQIGLVLVAAVAIPLGIAAMVNWVKMGEPSDVHPTPAPTVVTGTVAPTPLCTNVASSRCWEVKDGQNPSWVWREKAKVR